MVRRQHRHLGHRLELMRLHHGGELLAGGVRLADEFGMAQLVGQVDGQQIVFVMQRDIALALLGRPCGQRLGQLLARRCGALRARDFRN